MRASGVLLAGVQWNRLFVAHPNNIHWVTSINAIPLENLHFASHRESRSVGIDMTSLFKELIYDSWRIGWWWGGRRQTVYQVASGTQKVLQPLTWCPCSSQTLGTRILKQKSSVPCLKSRLKSIRLHRVLIPRLRPRRRHAQLLLCLLARKSTGITTDGESNERFGLSLYGTIMSGFVVHVDHERLQD